MATVLQQFSDKENVDAGSSVKNRVGLTFKRTQENASLVTPRRALGNINHDLNVSKQKTPGTLKVFKENASAKPRKALGSISENRLLSEVRPKKEAVKPLSFIRTNTAFQSTVTPDTDEIERFHKPQEVEDDYEDIFPKKERLSTYAAKLISWRPFCFKKWEDSDVEEDGDDEVEMLLSDDDIPDIPSISMDDIALCEADLYREDPEPIPEIPEISLPELDDDDFWKLAEELYSKISL